MPAPLQRMIAGESERQTATASHSAFYTNAVVRDEAVGAAAGGSIQTVQQV